MELNNEKQNDKLKVTYEVIEIQKLEIKELKKSNNNYKLKFIDSNNKNENNENDVLLKNTNFLTPKKEKEITEGKDKSSKNIQDLELIN